MSKTPTCKSWISMIQRCSNPKDADFHNYGGHGIKVCEDWLKFENFLGDMGVRPKGKTLDRIGHNRDYGPGNCRWATRIEQANNTRTSRWIAWNGEILTVAEWAHRAGLPPGTLRSRLNLGWTMERAFVEPVHTDMTQNLRQHREAVR